MQACQLIDLPSDILHCVLDNLLPPLTPPDVSSLPRVLVKTPDPLDVFQLMRTCRELHSLALPWLYKRLHCSGYPGKSDTRWMYLCDHPEVGVHVRLFIIDYGASPSEAQRSKLGALLSSMKLMDNLQVLIVTSEWSYNTIFPDEAQILTELVSKPRLHTLFIHSPYDPPPMPYPRTLRRLAYCGDSCDPWLRPLLPQLESLSIIHLGSAEQISPVSWERLRDIDIFTDTREGLLLLLDGLASWKRAFPGITSPLVEVTIRTLVVANDCRRITEAFRGPNLKKLSLQSVHLLDQAFLRHLVQEFPLLENLRLCTSAGSRWDVGLSEIAVLLGTLQMLRDLRWNYIDVPMPSNHLQDSPPIFRRILSVVVDHCPSLQRVHFHGIWDVFSYIRTEDGSFGLEAGSPSRSSQFDDRHSSFDVTMYDNI